MITRVFILVTAVLVAGLAVYLAYSAPSPGPPEPSASSHSTSGNCSTHSGLHRPSAIRPRSAA